MIEIIDKVQCVGCNACVQRCPKQCINMNIDEEGFAYPKVDMQKCINCGICEKVCPVINQPLDAVISQNRRSYACIANDEEILMQSSSGGIFTLFAKAIINTGGVVFGACFDDNFQVIHDYSETLQDCKKFMGSKYVQSRIGNSFSQVESFLKKGRPVLFSGTPCQILGLKLFLRKNYSGLMTIDIVCHAIPSPKIWQYYLDELKSSVHDSVNFDQIQFRNKTTGWYKYSFLARIKSINSISIVSQPHMDNSYMKGFLSGLFNRPSCYMCPAKNNKSGSDVTLADFWGIEKILPEIDLEKGVSLVIVNTSHGEKLFADCGKSITKKEIPFNDAIQDNQSYLRSAELNPKRKDFFNIYNKVGVSKAVDKLTRPSLIFRCKRSLYLLIESSKFLSDMYFLTRKHFK